MYFLAAVERLWVVVAAVAGLGVESCQCLHQQHLTCSDGAGVIDISLVDAENIGGSLYDEEIPPLSKHFF